MPTMSTARALAWNTGVQMIGKVASTILGVLVVGLMTRLLGQEGFGMYSTANAFFQVFGIILDLGLNVMLVQMLGEHAGDRAYEDRAVRATFSLRTIMAGIILTGAAFVGLAMPYPPVLKFAIFAIWGSFFFSSLSQIVIGVHQRHLKMHVVAIAEVAGRIVLLAGVLLAKYLGWGLIPIVTFVSLGGLTNFLILTLIANRYSSIALVWDPEFWKTILKRSWPIGVSILFNLVYFKADTLILSMIRSFSEVGVYGAAYRVLEILITIPFMYTGVLLPMLARAWIEKHHERFQSLYRNSLVAMLLLAMPMLGGVYVLGDRVMTTVAGNDFADSGSVLKILMIAAVMIFVGTVSSHVIVALDLQKKMLPVYFVVAAITLIGYLVCIPIYGMWGAAWLTVFSETCVAIAATWISVQKSGTRLFALPYLKIFFATIVMVLVTQLVKQMWLPIPILVGAISYTLIILGIGVIPPETMKEVLSLRRGSAPSPDAL